ncbi:NAD-dependent epimerase/dehydratase family protein [bacterium]|nr:NAD-dependent epimerase/dehydratase family protein [bacterium]MBU1435302.1 NAD-dependent epimerase/dehydratase family protein [bacterium]MBU1503500.1 NAD-dependent epimerase/dehydratase family protein [bacterium]
MYKILLTGSNGFIGTYFTNKYAKKYDIQKFSFLHDDFESLELQGTDVIVHLSALVHQMGGASADEYERVNVTQTLRLAKKAKESGVGHFIFMSSVKVYGEETDVVYMETTECRPQDDYGKSKRRAEKELQKMEDESFKVSIIRTPIVYGYGVKANIKNLVELVKRTSFLPFAKIENRRSMVYIGNLCHILDVVIQKKKEGIFLAADDVPLSTTKFIELIAKALDKKIVLLYIPFFETFLKIFKPSFHKRLYKNLEVDNYATMERLEITNPYSTKEGIEAMIGGEKE